jgi:hypothetical protein
MNSTAAVNSSVRRKGRNFGKNGENTRGDRCVSAYVSAQPRQAPAAKAGCAHPALGQLARGRAALGTFEYEFEFS